MVLYFIRWWRSVINNLENLVNWLQRRLIDEYFNQDAFRSDLSGQQLHGHCQPRSQKNAFEWAEQLYNCVVSMSSGGLINTCHGCTKDFSEISTAPFDPQIALAVCPTNILLRSTWCSKNVLVVRFIVFLVVFAGIHILCIARINMVSSHLSHCRFIWLLSQLTYSRQLDFCINIL